MVTSSAVVGSSAISRRGRFTIAMAIITAAAVRRIAGKDSPGRGVRNRDSHGRSASTACCHAACFVIRGLVLPSPPSLHGPAPFPPPIAYAHHRIQSCHRLLKNHRDANRGYPAFLLLAAQASCCLQKRCARSLAPLAEAGEVSRTTSLTCPSLNRLPARALPGTQSESSRRAPPSRLPGK